MTMSMDSSIGNHNTTGADILSSKVTRALEVRTDTAAMKAALEALSQIQEVDSRSVRVAIEQDALHQALLMQDELQHLVNVVQDLHKSVTDTAAIANLASTSIDVNVSVDQNNNSNSGSNNTTETGEPTTPQAAPNGNNNDDKNLEQEQSLASELARAFEERNQAQLRAKAVEEFLNKFDLSSEESRLLEQYNFEDLQLQQQDSSCLTGMAFLDALDRVRTIRLELSKTFGTTTTSRTSLTLQDATTIDTSTDDAAAQKQNLGATSAIRMMESLASKQERAYERLYHWLQKHLALGSDANQQQVDQDAMDEALCHDFIKRSLFTLKQHVPAFYAHLVELIASSRRSEETRRFLLALTSGYNGMPPIEVKAHDPVVYVGDMLAHVFRSLSVEADVARGLVQYQPQDNDDEEASNVDGDDDDMVLGMEKPMSAGDVVGHAMSGVSRPLKSRIHQVIGSLARRPGGDHHQQEDDDLPHDDSNDEESGGVSRSRVSSLYSICGLLLFYHSAFDKAMQKLATDDKDDKSSNTSPLVTAVLECLEEASQAYAASLRVYGAMLESLTLISGESEASLANGMVVSIAEVRMASPGFAADVPCPSGNKASGNNSIESSLSLEFLCETLIEAGLSSCKSLDDAVTLKLSVTTAQKAGLNDEISSRFNNLISDKEQVMIDALVESETKEVLDLCGLGSLSVAWTRMQQVHVEGMTMSSHPGLTPPQVETSIKEFYASLYSPPIPSYEDVIKDPVLRKRAQSQIASRVADMYEKLYHAMQSDKGGYEDLSFLGHTPNQVRTLFSV